MSDKLRLLSLFAGIGGFELGLERSGGFQTVAQCEIEPYCNKVLARHWPEVKRYGDIRELTAARLAADGIAVDAICGGFPCQDISSAGKKVGIKGERSGLWGEYARLVGELRPRVVFVENVTALLSRGLDRVLGDLAALGYDAVWDGIPASAVGAPHDRDRVWVIGYSNEDSQSGRAVNDEAQGLPKPSPLTHSECRQREVAVQLAGAWGQFKSLPRDGFWAPENSPMGMGVDDGLPGRLDRLRALGNAVVPQIPELLGRAYLQAMETTHV